MDIGQLPFDILSTLLGSIQDRGTLYHCILVCRSFHEAALPSLYRAITLKSVSNDGSGSTFNALRTLDKHTYLRSYVRYVEFCFVLNEYVRRGNTWVQTTRTADSTWATSLSKLPNITSFTFLHPERQFHPFPHDLIETTVSALSNCAHLQEINLLSRVSATDMTCCNRLSGVQSIRLGLPSKDIFTVISPFAQRWRSFSIIDAYALNSVSQLQPYIGNLTSLHLGSHHALSNHDLIALLTNTPDLQSLDIFYDNLLNVRLLNKHQRSFAGLKNLDRVVLRYQGVSSKAQFNEMFDWLELITASSPLTSLSLLSDDEKECNYSSNLMNILIKKDHLEFLNIPYVVLRQQALKLLLGHLTKLETLSLFLVDINVFKDLTVDVPHKFALRNLYLRSNRATCAYSLVPQQVQRMMKMLRKNPGNLRRLFQERQTWQALWTEGNHTDRKGINALEDEYPLDYSY